MKSTSWFQVDRAGLGNLVKDGGGPLVLRELISNAWDTGSTLVEVELTKLPGRPAARLLVRDNNPDGFADLSHAYTLFAKSSRADQPEQRGRFNLGEKLALALCRHAVIRSTTGTLHFNEDGTRERTRVSIPKGSEFEAEIKVNAAEFEELHREFWRLIPPPKCHTKLDGQMLLRPNLVTEFDVVLPTVIPDDEGALRPTRRIAHVEIFEVSAEDDRGATIFEMGIPVVVSGDKYHVTVGQKVPLTMTRDNVPPAYLRELRAAVLNHTAERLTASDASESWVTNAMEDKHISKMAVVTAVEKRYGKKRAVYDPSDREANMDLTADGFTVIPPAAFSKAAWSNIREAEAALPSGRIRPTPRPYSNDGDDEPRKEIPPEEWTPGMIQVHESTRWIAKRLKVNQDLEVNFVLPKVRHWAACFGGGTLEWNVSCLGRKWFDTWHTHPAELVDTIIHELAHSKADNHLEDAFHKACTKLGAQLVLEAFLDGDNFPHFNRVREHKET